MAGHVAVRKILVTFFCEKVTIPIGKHRFLEVPGSQPAQPATRRGRSTEEQGRAGGSTEEERGLQLDFWASPLDPSDLKHLKVLDVLNSRSPFEVGGFKHQFEKHTAVDS